MTGTDCCKITGDWVSVKKWDANTGAFLWEILNLRHGTGPALDLGSRSGGLYEYPNRFNDYRAMDGSKFLYLGYTDTESGNIDAYETIWGNLSYPVAIAYDFHGPDNQGFSQNFRTVPTYWGGNVEFIDGVQVIIEHGVYKINAETGDIISKQPLVFSYTTLNVNGLALVFDVKGPWTPVNKTVENRGSTHFGNTFPSVAGDFLPCDRPSAASSTDGNTFIMGLNAANPDTRNKTYILAFNIFEDDFETYPNGTKSFPQWELFLPDVNDLGEQTITIHEGMSNTAIENEFLNASHILSATVIGDKRYGYLTLKLVFISDEVINFQQVRKAQSNHIGNPVGGNSIRSPDLMWMNISTLKNHIYFIHDYPLPAVGPFERADRPNGRYNINRSTIFMFGLDGDTDNPRLFFYTKYSDYLLYFDSFTLDPDVLKPTIGWTQNIFPVDSDGNALVTKFLPPYPGPFGIGFGIQPSTYLDFNSTYIALFNETVRSSNHFLPQYNGKVINATTGSTVWEEGDSSLTGVFNPLGLEFATNSAVSQLTGESSDIFGIRALSLVADYGDDDRSSASHEFVLSYYQTWSGGTIQRASNHPHGGFMLSDNDSLINFAKGIPIEPQDSRGAMKDVIPDYTLVLQPTSDTISSNFTGQGWTLAQNNDLGNPATAAYPAHTFSDVDLTLPRNVYLDRGSSGVTGLRYRLYANYAITAGEPTQDHFSPWFTVTSTHTAIQAWLDSIFGLSEAIGFPSFGESNALLNPFGQNGAPTSITGDIVGVTANTFGSALIAGGITDYYSTGGGLSIWFRARNQRSLGLIDRSWLLAMNGGGLSSNRRFGIQYEQYSIESAYFTKSTFSTPNTDSIVWSRNPVLSSENTVIRRIEKGRSKVLRDDTIISVYPRSQGSDSEFPFAVPETLNTSDSIYSA